MTSQPKRIAIVGGGWYGCHLALSLLRDGFDVTVYEKQFQPFNGASGKTQFRLHHGFHYPRSFHTREQIIESWDDFLKAYPELITTIDRNLYCIAAQKSIIDFPTYEQVLSAHGIPFSNANSVSEGFTNVEGCVHAFERALYVTAPIPYFKKRLGDHLVLGKEVLSVQPLREGVEGVEIRLASKPDERVSYDWCINATYNQWDSGVADCFFELCLSLIYHEKTRYEHSFDALTVMDGEFCSIYPYIDDIEEETDKESPRRYTLTAVKYTPMFRANTMKEINEWEEKNVSDDYVRNNRRELFEKVALHFYPEFNDRFEYKGFFTSVKTKVVNDSTGTRETIVGQDGRYIRVFSGKVNTIFEAEREIRKMMFDKKPELLLHSANPLSQEPLCQNSCLIGYTGFVGRTLRNAAPFSHLYNSKNINDICGQSYDFVVCCGMPAAKWLANKYPEVDDANTDMLISKLKCLNAKRFVLISTVDVYPKSEGDEDFCCHMASSHTYGRNRLKLEDFVRSYFPNYVILRLPACFGKYLKKNYIYDLLNNHDTEKINPNSAFQWYDVDSLWSHIKLLEDHQDIRLINLVPEPVETKDILALFPNARVGPPSKRVTYNLTTKFAHIFNSGVSGYLANSLDSMNMLRKFVVWYRNPYSSSKFCVSQIAYGEKDETKVLSLLSQRGISKIEIAPTKIVPGWDLENWAHIQDYKSRMTQLGFSFPSMAGILFQMDHLQMFTDYDTRSDLLTHLFRVIDFAKFFEVKVLVFGAPKIRGKNGLSHSECFKVAVEFFRKLGVYAARSGCCIGIEPLPNVFMSNISEVAEVVRSVDHPGIRLHLDSASVFLVQDETSKISENKDILVHAHVSEPGLASFEVPKVDHVSIAETLKESGYDGNVSLEMRMWDKPYEKILEAVNFMTGVY